MKVILYMAMSVNGMIAKENGEEDFLSHANWETFIELATKAGNFIYGRKTYESVITWGKEYVGDIAQIPKRLVLSQNFSGQPQEGFVLAHSPQEAIQLLEKEGFTEVIVTGGATNNSAFAKAGLIDEVIFNIEPILLGKGVSLFKQEDFEMKLQLQDIKKLSNGLLQIIYNVVK